MKEIILQLKLLKGLVVRNKKVKRDILIAQIYNGKVNRQNEEVL